MKIAIIFPKHSEALFYKNSTRTFGGASVQMYNIAKELHNHKDIETFSFIPYYKNINFKENTYFNLVKVFNENDNLFIKTFKFLFKLNKIKPDIVIQHGLTNESCLLAKYCKLKGIKFIFMFASDVEVKGLSQTKHKKIILFNLLLKNSYKIITQNTYQKKYLKIKYGTKSIIVKNGFEIPKNQYVKKHSILWVARCDELKKPKLFLELAKEIKEYNFVMICPKSYDPKLFFDVKSQAKKIKNLSFFDFVPNNKIKKYFQEAKLFINTSDYEGFPQTFIQATMYSTPIISLNSNPDNFITKYNCGFCTKGDVKKIVNFIRNISENSKLYIKLSKNSFKYAKENHDIKKNVSEIIKVIQNE